MSSYDSSAYTWKEEDLPFILRIREKNLFRENPQEWRKCVDVWKKAEEEYGKEMSFWADIFEPYSANILLNNFGFEYSSVCEGEKFKKSNSPLDFLSPKPEPFKGIKVFTLKN